VVVGQNLPERVHLVIERRAEIGALLDLLIALRPLNQAGAAGGKEFAHEL
jgi:hypothetical protein